MVWSVLLTNKIDLNYCFPQNFLQLKIIKISNVYIISHNISSHLSCTLDKSVGLIEVGAGYICRALTQKPGLQCTVQLQLGNRPGRAEHVLYLLCKERLQQSSVRTVWVSLSKRQTPNIQL